jgi:ubiquitin-protein ligase
MEYPIKFIIPSNYPM